VHAVSTYTPCLWNQKMEQRALKIVNNCLNSSIYSYLDTSDHQSSNLYLNVVHFFSMPVFIGHLLQLKAVVFLHWCLIHTILLFEYRHLLLLRDI
jgi:hypothetical protein